MNIDTEERTDQLLIVMNPIACSWLDHAAVTQTLEVNVWHILFSSFSHFVMAFSLSLVVHSTVTATLFITVFV